MPSVPGGLLPTMPTMPTPTQMTNEKQQRPAHSERATGHWINLFFSIAKSGAHTTTKTTETSHRALHAHRHEQLPYVFPNGGHSGA
jgi:hypothetical protein